MAKVNAPDFAAESRAVILLERDQGINWLNRTNLVGKSKKSARSRLNNKNLEER